MNGERGSDKLQNERKEDSYRISKEDVRAINRMKSGKALGPHNIPVELWDCLVSLREQGSGLCKHIV